MTDRGGGRVVAVLGYSRRRDRGLHPVCAERLIHAERLADDALAVDRVGLVAGAARAVGKAERMAEAWGGPDVPLVSDQGARATAENAANVAAAAAALGADEVVVVTSRWHRPRAAVLLRAAFHGSGVRVTVVGAPGRVPRLAAAREVACLVLLPLQLPLARRPRRAPVSPAGLPSPPPPSPPGGAGT